MAAPIPCCCGETGALGIASSSPPWCQKRVCTVEGDAAHPAGERLGCASVVLTTGTFLRGVIHVGSQSRPAGRMPAASTAPSAAAAAAAAASDAADTTAAIAAGVCLLVGSSAYAASASCV